MLTYKKLPLDIAYLKTNSHIDPYKDIELVKKWLKWKYLSILSYIEKCT